MLGFEGLDLCGAGLLDAAAALRGDVLTAPSAFAYALPYVGGEAPDVRNSDLTSLELLARYKTEATANADGSFTYGLSGLEPGTYHVVARELRAPSSGISAIDRVGHQADVEVVAGEAATADVTVVPLYTLR